MKNFFIALSLSLLSLSSFAMENCLDYKEGQLRDQCHFYNMVKKRTELDDRYRLWMTDPNNSKNVKKEISGVYKETVGSIAYTCPSDNCKALSYLSLTNMLNDIVINGKRLNK